jgi:hypothetical protein
LEQLGGEIDRGGEEFIRLLGGNASKGFYAAEEVFDEMPPLVFFLVMLGISPGSLSERNDRIHDRVCTADFSICSLPFV